MLNTNIGKGIWGIVLAAGMSNRMGTPKMLLHYKNKSLVQHVIHGAIHSKLEGIVVVFNPQVKGLYKEIIDCGVDRIVENRFSQKGMSTSLRKGISSLPEGVEAAVILLGDQPEMTNKEINKIIDTYHTFEKPLIVQSLYLNNEKGHPVLFNKKIFSKLLEVGGDTGGKKVIKAFADKTAFAEMKKENIRDIDYLEDYKRLVMKRRLNDE